DSLNSVCVTAGFIRPIPLYARKTESQGGRVSGRLLDIAERDLSHQLRTDIDGPVIAAHFKGQEFFRLPPQHLVRQPFKSFPEHHELSALKIQGTQMQV